MNSNVIIDSKASNLDTSPSKIVNFEHSSDKKSAKKPEISAEFNEKAQATDNASASATSFEGVSGENSTFYTDNFNKTAPNPKNQNSDTSTNIIDPLSVIDCQHRVESKQNDTPVENENLVFSQLFPSVSLEKLRQDELFALFSGHNGKNLTISELYTNYLRLTNALNDDFVKKSLVSLQNKLTSPGSLASSEKPSEIFFTKEQVLRMSPEQISVNYDNIRKSQQKW